MPNRGHDSHTRLSRRRLLQAAGAVGAGSLAVGGGRAAGGDLLWEQSFSEQDFNYSSDPGGLTVIEQTILAERDYKLYALNSQDGSDRWQFETQNRINSTPKAVGGTVYVPSANPDLTSGTVHAVDLGTGIEQWQQSVGACYSSVYLWQSTLLVPYDKGRDEGIVALDVSNGSEQWRTPLSLGFGPHAVADGMVCSVQNSPDNPSLENTIHSLNATDGTVQWNTSFDLPATAPSITDSRVILAFVPRSGTSVVRALSREDGSTDWTFETAGRVRAPTVWNGRVYVTAESDGDRRLFALDASTGSVDWRRSVTNERGSISVPTVADETVFFATENTTYAVDATDGTEVWRVSRGGAPSLVVGGVLYGQDSDQNTVYALDAGVAGSSEDSLVRQGTRGHHDGRGGGSITLTERQENGVSVTTEEQDGRKETTVSVAEATAGDTVDIPLDLRISGSTTIDELAVTPAADGGFELTITSDDEPLETTPEVPMLTPDQQLGFFSIDSTLPNGDIEQAVYRYSIDPEAAEGDIDPQEVTLYRFEDDAGTWAGYPTEVVDEGDVLQFETTAPGFSEWTAGSDRPDISITDAEASVSTVQTGEEFDIDVTLRNPDEASDVYVTELLFEGEVVERRRPRVPAETSIIVTFSRNLDREGEYTVRVNDVEVGTVTVQDGQVRSDGNQTVSPTTERADDSSPPWPWILGGLGALGGGGYLLQQSTQDDTDEQP